MKKALIQLHIAVFLAGFTAVLGKLIGLNEGLLVWYRLLITVIALWLLLYLTKSMQRVAVTDRFKILGVGVIVALHWVAFYGSIKYANISIAVTCLAAAGFFTALLEPILFRRRIDSVEALLGLVSVIGISVIFDFHPEYKKGIAFGIVSALASAIFPIFNKKLVTRFDARTLTLYELGGGLVGFSFILPFYLKLFPAAYYLPTFSDWVWLSILAIICTALCFDLQLNALKKISAFTSTLTYNLEPVYGIILGFIIFHENKELHPQFYIGVALIILAVFLQMMRIRAIHRKSINN
jgi:drug/metabolite transporter (DMT)-like permease